MRKAYIIFEDSPHPLLKGLRQGYRHVSVLMPVKQLRHMYIHIDQGYRTLVGRSELPLIYDNAGNTITVLPYRTKARISYEQHIQAVSCVTQVKRALGIRAWWIITPWQLYNYLQRRL